MTMLAFVLLLTMTVCALPVWALEFRSSWPEDAERVWIGPQYWANRLQDWRIANGRLECVTSGFDRNVHVLTCQLGKQRGDFQMSVNLGRLDRDVRPGDGWVGFRIGAQTPYGDYRRYAIYGEGIDAGITTDGTVFIKTPAQTKSIKVSTDFNNIKLQVSATEENETYKIVLSVGEGFTEEILGAVELEGISPEQLVGNLALVCSKQQSPTKRKFVNVTEGRHFVAGEKNDVSFWFKGWRIQGEKLDIDDSRCFGPILFVQHTLSKKILKMTAQMPPIGGQDSKIVRLQLFKQGTWQNVAEASIDPLSRTAAFRKTGWDDSKDFKYRIAYKMKTTDGGQKDFYWTGTIRKDPVDKETITVAGFTGNNDVGFPNADVVNHVRKHEPDLLVFTGDQIYERVGGYGVQYSPMDKACLDYLHKWYIFGWSYRELMRDIPCVCLLDDHDVFHGNLWGAGGKRAGRLADDKELPAEYGGDKESWSQDQGGYKMPAEWVNMAERTQTSHLPDPFDPTPVKQGIGVYYCELKYGQVSFAVIEDRKFKSSATPLIPDAKIVNGFFHNPNFDPKNTDVTGAELLGQRQLKFLNQWAEDWSDGVWMKVVLSQTIFADVATLPKPVLQNLIAPKLRILQFGEYPENDEMTADTDTHGWPQTGRNKALREMRRAFAFHLAGDQHLATVTQYGIEKHGDCGFAFCVPAVSNIWPRRWFPSVPGENRAAGSPEYTGDFTDRFGNLVSVFAVSNPVFTGREPSELHDRATGYGIVKFNRPERTITMECWPRYADPADPATGGQYPGWPKTIHMEDNYGREAYGYLPTIEVKAMTDAVVQVIDQADNEIVYTLRIKGTVFSPRIFRGGKYTVKVGEPDEGNIRVIKDILPLQKGESRTIEVVF